MLRWLKQFTSISRNSFTVLLGDPFFFILHLSLISFIALIGCLPGFAFGEQIRMLRDESLAVTFLCGCLAAALGADHVIGEDLRKGTVSMIMSRPVSPVAFILGKWTGLIASLTIIHVSATTACLWITRLNYYEHHLEIFGLIFYILIVFITLILLAIKHYFMGGCYVWQANLALGISFVATFLLLNFWGYNGRMPSTYGALVDWNTYQVFLMIFMAIIVFSAIISSLSVIMDHSMLMGVAAALFIGGLFSEYVINTLPLPEYFRTCLKILTPNWQTFWTTETLAGKACVPWNYINSSLFHAIGQSVIFITFGRFLFQQQEITKNQ